jgi:uncharacterized protein YndB with AHSA1/START domain
MTTFDLAGQIGAVRRAVLAGERDGVPTRSVVISQTYDATLDDVWDAITTADRIDRWLMPISGDLRLGGRYQLEGNAGGEIQVCEPPERLELTWEWGDDISWVMATLSADGDRTTLEIEHIAPVSPHWGEFGPAAVGMGWDLMLLGLASHLRDGPLSAPRKSADEVTGSDAGRSFMADSSVAWAEAAIAAGDDPEAARAAAGRTCAMYTGASPEGSGDAEEGSVAG